MKILDRIFYKLGYTRKEEHLRDVQNLRLELRAEKAKYKALEDADIDTLVKAISSVNMIKAIMDWNGVIMFAEEDASASVKMKYEYPPEPNWYMIKVALDVGKLQRIYQDMTMADNSPEYEYFKRSIVYKIEHDIDVLMRLHGAIK